MPEPVLVRNNEKGPSVFTDANTKHEIEWAGAGDPTGNDLQYVPVDVLQNPSFMRSLNKGIFTVVQADAETTAALAKQTETWRERQATIEEHARQSIDGTTTADVAAAQINEKGQVTSVPTVTGVKTSQDGTGDPQQVEQPTQVIIDQRQSAPAAPAPAAVPQRQPVTQ